MASKRQRANSQSESIVSGGDTGPIHCSKKKAKLKAKRKARKQMARQKAAAARVSEGDTADVNEEEEEEDESFGSGATTTAEVDEDELDSDESSPDDNLQGLYFVPYEYPSMSREEARAMFDIRSIDIRVRPAPPPALPSPEEKICSVCIETGHLASKCPELTCKHCGERDKHFANSCPARPADDSSASLPSPTYDWRSEVRREPPSQRGALKAFCYNCAGYGHYGYDCPQRPVVGRPGAFSGTFALQLVDPADSQSLPQYNRSTAQLSTKMASFIRSAGEASNTFDPFAEYRQTDEAKKHRPFFGSYHGSGYRGRGAGPSHGGRGGSRYDNSYRPRDSYQGGGGGGLRDSSNRNSYRPMPSAATSNWRRYKR